MRELLDHAGPILYGLRRWAAAFVGATLDALRRRDSELTEPEIVA